MWVLAHPGSSTQSTGPAPGTLASHPASHPASLPYEEWNAAPPERGVVGQAPQTDGHDSRALTVVGQGEGPCQWLLSPASAAPPAVR